MTYYAGPTAAEEPLQHMQHIVGATILQQKLFKQR